MAVGVVIRRVGAFTLALALAGCGGDVPAKSPVKPVARTAARPGTGSVMTGVRVRQYVGGRLEVELVADEAWHSRGADWVSGRGVRARYYPLTRKPANLEATTARYLINAQRLQAGGFVRVESEGTVLETTELTYDGARDRIASRSRVRVTRGGNVMTGIGLEADPDLGNLTLGSPEIEARQPGELRPLMDAAGAGTPAPKEHDDGR